MSVIALFLVSFLSKLSCGSSFKNWYCPCPVVPVNKLWQKLLWKRQLWFPLYNVVHVAITTAFSVILFVQTKVTSSLPPNDIFETLPLLHFITDTKYLSFTHHTWKNSVQHQPFILLTTFFSLLMFNYIRYKELAHASFVMIAYSSVFGQLHRGLWSGCFWASHLHNHVVSIKSIFQTKQKLLQQHAWHFTSSNHDLIMSN
jgi:hypothetical protein